MLAAGRIRGTFNRRFRAGRCFARQRLGWSGSGIFYRSAIGCRLFGGRCFRRRIDRSLSFRRCIDGSFLRDRDIFGCRSFAFNRCFLGSGSLFNGRSFFLHRFDRSFFSGRCLFGRSLFYDRGFFSRRRFLDRSFFCGRFFDRSFFDRCFFNSRSFFDGRSFGRRRFFSGWLFHHRRFFRHGCWLRCGFWCRSRLRGGLRLRSRLWSRFRGGRGLRSRLGRSFRWRFLYWRLLLRRFLYRWLGLRGRSLAADASAIHGHGPGGALCLSQQHRGASRIGGLLRRSVGAASGNTGRQ
ncbi:hypothetical protein GCM10007908_28180 [Rhizobium albus]|nr:hypothetical protein GCM10007908_28180 [Rhizobium albus]